MDCRLLITSDVHGCISPYSYSDKKEIAAGLAKLTKVIAEYRDENTLLLDNGDILQGSPLLYHHQLFKHNETNPMVKIMDYLDYDYLNTGNHDFNYGAKNLRDFYRDVKAKWITGNIYENGVAINPAYTVIELPNKVKIALFGCVTHYIPNWEHPDHIKGYTFEEALAFVKRTVAYIKKNETVDHIICMYHGGIERDIVTGKETETLTGENQGYEICRQVKDLDLLITGHQHRSLVTKIFNTTITQTAQDAQEIAVIDIYKDHIDAKLVKVSDVIDNKMLDLVKEAEESTQIWLDKPLGKLKQGNLLVNDMFDARLHKHPLVSFLNQVQMASANIDIAAVGLANKVYGFNNKITMRDIISSYVYPNSLVVVELTGRQLKEALEKSAEYFSDKDGEIVVTDSFEKPKPKHYNYDMFDGIDYTIKVSNPIGKRIIKLTYKGKRIDEDGHYQVAMNNYRAVGGGDYDVYKKAKLIKDTQKHIVDCIADYIIAHKIIEVDHHANITVIV